MPVATMARAVAVVMAVAVGALRQLRTSMPGNLLCPGLESLLDPMCRSFLSFGAGLSCRRHFGHPFSAGCLRIAFPKHCLSGLCFGHGFWSDPVEQPFPVRWTDPTSC